MGDNAKRENREETVRNRCGLPTLFLKLNGFHALRDENSANTQYVRVVGRIVSSIKGKDIRTFLRQFARERYLDRNIRNLILNSPRMSDGALENLDEITLDFTSYTRKSQYFSSLMQYGKLQGIR